MPPGPDPPEAIHPPLAEPIDGASEGTSSDDDLLPKGAIRPEGPAAIVRVLLVVFVGLLSIFVPGAEGTVPWVAYALLLVAGAYSLYLLRDDPYRRYGAEKTKLLVSAADLALILGWLYATGGFTSPFHPLLYASAIALSFRYDLWRTLLGAVAHAGGYVGLLYVLGELAENQADVTVTTGFILLLGTLGSLLSIAAGRGVVDEGDYRDLLADRDRTISLHEATLDATTDGILVVDLRGRIVSYNDRFQTMWDIPDEIVQTRDDEQAIGYVLDQLEDPEAFLDRVSELYDSPAEQSEDEIRLKDGRVFERSSRPHRLGDEIVGRVWSFHDVTEERGAQAELERSNEELRRFTSAVSHDLREPLRMIRSYLDLIEARAGDALDAETREHIGIARDGADRLERMIEGLLRYSRVERRGEPLGRVALDDPVEDAWHNLQAQAEEAGARLETGELPEVQGDRAQLTTLFQNLFANAIRYNDAAVPEIEVAAEATPAGWRIEVSDNGVGIPAKEQEEVFEMFRRGSNAAASEGEGIGLAMCQRIVDRHGGQLELESTVGDGTTFAFTLQGVDETALT